MNPTSLRFRLLSLSFASIALALVVTTYVLNDRFYGYFEARILAELEQHLEQLAASLSLDEAGNIIVASLPDRRFQQPFSGLYWQVETAGSAPFLSRSLWGDPVAVPAGIAAGERFVSNGSSPTGAPVLISGWVVVMGEGEGRRELVLAVATDETEVREATEGFHMFLLKWLGVLMLLWLLGAWVQIQFGLAPLSRIRRKVEAVKAGDETRLYGQFPSEVQPLVDEVNTLLTAHDGSLKAARAKASDLAHGLKTPLTVMRALLHELSGQIGTAKTAEMEAQISAMHQFIERELAQVRKDHSGTQHTPVGPAVAQMVASMQKLPRGDGLDWQIDLPEGLTIPFDAHDLSELLGNVLDNARKWAATKVLIEGVNGAGNSGRLSIQDDGQGVPVGMMQNLSARGHSVPATELGTELGTGLGLAICKDLLGGIGGHVVFSHAPLGGLKVSLCWPES